MVSVHITQETVKLFPTVAVPFCILTWNSWMFQSLPHPHQHLIFSLFLNVSHSTRCMIPIKIPGFFFPPLGTGKFILNVIEVQNLEMSKQFWKRRTNLEESFFLISRLQKSIFCSFGIRTTIQSNGT